MYKVKWQGYDDPGGCTWEAATHLENAWDVVYDSSGESRQTDASYRNDQ